MNLISTPKTMSSREIAELTDKKHGHVFRDIGLMLNDLDIYDQDEYIQEWIHPQNKRTYMEYILDRELTDCLLTGYNARARIAVIKRWHELEAQTTKPMSQLEMIAGMATSMVEVERKQLEQAQAVAAIESKLEQVEAKVGSQVWDECPVNALAISAIRHRINDKYSIPSWAVDEIVRGGYGPRPAGQVRNSHENANGRTYTVYWLSDITKLFDRIVRDAEPVTATLCTHDYVSKRFKLINKEGK